MAKTLPCELIVRFENYSAQSLQDEQMRWHGLDVDFAKALLDEAGCGYRFISIPWGRALKMLEMGEIDLMLSVSKTAQRMRFAYFIGPQREENIVFAFNAQRPFYVQSLEELFSLPRPVAIQRGAYYGEAFEARMKQESDSEDKFIYVPDNQLKLNLLRHGRISGFLEEKYNIVYQREYNPDFVEIDIAPFVVNVEPVYIALSKQSVSKSVIDKLTRAFKRLNESGKFEQILKKYKLD
ncbi:ABC transporter substrate-binding protein [Pseudoalteromonas sp. A25]|uniref:substrate-binding periplasmic protein n=1 Tax=Pseudoalteromonas sp. A25 TaxID=116092 RepID=UPI0012612894|nr:transporter substrate-binding domain-containing protein [Pseudoalteromonas sp. A25]BBN80276.1 ABC transporter substrate-binding protein [Pseudoalteromonas sp. A25]